MRRRRTVGAGALVLCVGAVAACTSSSHPSNPSPSSTSPSTTASRAAGGAGRDSTPTALATTLRTALAPLTSARLGLSSTVAGQALTGSGAITLDAGELIAADVTEQLPSGLGSIRIVRTGGTTYAKLPAALGNAAKPWLVLRADSSSAVVAQLAGTVDSLLTVAAPKTLVSLVAAASSASDLGAATIAGAPAHHYRVVVAPAKLPAGLTASKATPVDLYLDAKNRPVRVDGTFVASGQQLSTTISLSDFDHAAAIAAPPAGQISGG